VASLTSGAVERAILYCGGEYGRCDIYRRLAKTKHEQEGKDTEMKTRGEEVSDGNAVNVQENSRKGG